MDADPRFQSLIRRSRAGSEAAIRELLEEYGPHVLRAVRRRLSPQLRRVFDSQDFIQEVWHSFFKRFPDRLDFASPKALQVFLREMAKNKVVDASRRDRRGGEVSPDSTAGVRPLASHSLGEEPVGRDRTASEAAMSNEARERLAGLPPDAYPRIVDLLRRGYSQKEVAELCGVSVRTLRRTIRKNVLADPELQRRAAESKRTRRAFAAYRRQDAATPSSIVSPLPSSLNPPASETEH